MDYILIWVRMFVCHFENRSVIVLLPLEAFISVSLSFNDVIFQWSQIICCTYSLTLTFEEKKHLHDDVAH